MQHSASTSSLRSDFVLKMSFSDFSHENDLQNDYGINLSQRDSRIRICSEMLNPYSITDPLFEKFSQTILQ